MSQLPWPTSKYLTDDEFYNRTQEINNLINILKSTGENNAPKLLLTGIRGVGKTVLLHKIKKMMDEDYLVIYMDLSMSQSFQKNNMSIKGILDYYYKQIIEECKEKNIKIFDKNIKKYFKTHNFEINDYKNINGIPIPLINSKVDIEKYKEFIFNLPQNIYNDYKNEFKGVIVFIDEFQIIKELGNYLESFLWNFRGYISNQRNVGYIISGSMSLQDKLIYDISSNDGVFGNRMISMHINPFSEETVKNYLNEKVPEIIFNQEAFKRFYKCTSGNPSIINTFARLLPTNKELTEDDVISCFDNNLEFIATNFINQWNRLTKKDKELLIALIDTPLKRVDLAKKLNVKSGSLSDRLTKLQNLDLIVFQDSKYEFSAKLLRRWLIIKYNQMGVYPYRV